MWVCVRWLTTSHSRVSREYPNPYRDAHMYPLDDGGVIPACWINYRQLSWQFLLLIASIFAHGLTLVWPAFPGAIGTVGCLFTISWTLQLLWFHRKTRLTTHERSVNMGYMQCLPSSSVVIWWSWQGGTNVTRGAIFQLSSRGEAW